MFLALFAIFVLGPIAEIYVLIKTGSAFGALPVISACLFTAALGALILRIQGFAAAARARADLKDGKPPVAAAVDGIFLLIAAPFLLTPGFLTDALGFLLLVPPLRRAIARFALSRLRASMARGRSTVIIHRP